MFEYFFNIFLEINRIRISYNYTLSSAKKKKKQVIDVLLSIYYKSAVLFGISLPFNMNLFYLQFSASVETSLKYFIFSLLFFSYKLIQGYLFRGQEKLLRMDWWP